MNKRLLSILLALCMMFTGLPSSALAASNVPIDTGAEIIAFEALTEAQKTVPLGTPEADLALPVNLMAKVKTTATTNSGIPSSGAISQEEDMLIAVTWISNPQYNMDTAGMYTFSPVINGYTVSTELPEIAVTVGATLMMPLMAGAPIEVNSLSELQAAINNAMGDLNLKLSDSYTSSVGTLTIGTNYNFTIDLNGKTLDGGENTAIVQNGTGTLTIIDSGTGGRVTTDNPSSSSGAIYIQTGNLEINGGTVSALYCAIYNDGDGAVSISGGTVSSTKGKAIYNKLTGTVSLTGGLVSSSEDIAIYTNVGYNGKIIIPSGNPLILGAYQVMNKAPDLSGYDDVKIQGSTTSAKGTGVGGITKSDIDTDEEVRNYKTLSFWKDDSPQLYTITYDPNGVPGSANKRTAGRGIAVQLPGGGLFTPPDGKRFKAWAIGSPSGLLVYEWDSYMFMADTTVYAVWDDTFVEINGKGYPTLQAAVNAVKEGETIKLLSDISLANQSTVTTGGSTPSFRLDLNGKTLDSKEAVGQQKPALRHYSSGTLTIIDSSPNAAGKITSPNFRTLENTGNLIIAGGTVENAAVSAGGSSAIYLSGQGSVTVSGGVVNVIDIGVAIDSVFNATGSVNISGGMVSANGSTSIAIRNTQGTVNITGGIVRAGLAAIHNEKAGKITISGNAKVTSTNGRALSGTIFLNEGTADKTVLEITGGIVENTVWGDAIYNNANGKIAIPSGTPIITGKIQAMNKAPDLSGYADVKITASTTDANGSDAVSITNSDIDTDAKVKAYKYLNFGQITAPVAYTITYDANGGSGSMSDDTATQGTAFTLPDSSFTGPEGRRFKAWAIGSRSGSQVIPDDTYLFTADTTVYAVWEDIPTVIVAEINSRGYDTLQKAFDAVTEGQTIKLLSNITLKDTVNLVYGKPSFTLDLNGQTLDGRLYNVILHNGRCTLTIADSGTGGKITSALVNGVTGTIRMYNGSLVVTGGTVENTGTHGRGAIYTENSGNVSIQGGTVSSSPTGILNNIGSVTVSGGMVSADNGGAIFNTGIGRVTVSGGTVSGGYTPAIYNQGTGKITVSGNAKLTSNNSGGTISLNLGTVDNTVLEITGGTIENAEWGYGINNYGNGKIVIPSGTPVIKSTNIAMNKAPDLSGYDDPKITGSKTDANGSDAVSITKTDIDTDAKVKAYKYLNFGQTVAPATYTITYNPSGGSGSMTSDTASQGTAFTLPASSFTPPSGKRFKAWAIGSTSGTQVNAGGSYTFTADTTVYALWEDSSSATYTITYNANGGSGVMPNGTASQGTAFTLPVSSFTAPSGKRFKAWAIGNTSGTQVNAGASHTFTADTTVYALWESVPSSAYTITYNANGGSVSPATATTNSEQKLTTLPTPTRSEYTFGGWYTAATGGTAVTTSTVFTRNTTIYAHWTAVSVNISGVVKDHESNPSQYATVKLQQGAIEVASTLTDVDGHYEILNVKPGIYNIVVIFGGRTYTLDTIKAIDKDIIINPQLPDIDKNTFLIINGSVTPNVTVDGLVTVSRKNNADITMIVEEKPESAADHASGIKALAPGKMLQYLDISLKAGESPLSSAGSVLEIIIPFDFTNKQSISVYRYHDNAQAFIEADTGLDGTFMLDRINHVIRVFASQFSTYAIGYSISTDDSSPSSDDARNDSELWEDVREAIDDAAKNEIIKVDAKPTDAMPWDVMEKLYDNQVGLIIEYPDGKKIYIPAGKAVDPKAESGRLYYPISYLEKLFAVKQAEAPSLSTNSNRNPKTGAVV